MSGENLFDKSHTHEAILEEFECPVCVDYMVPPIKSCVAGHNFCQQCDKKLARCPICRGDKIEARNLGMEKIFNKLIVPCTNRIRGCTIEAVGANLKEHQQHCQYRILVCPLRVINNCKGKGQLKDLVAHCVAKHTSNVFCTNIMQLVWPRFRYAKILRPNQPGDSFHVICQAYGGLFKCIWDMDIDTGFIRWCVVYMGPASDIDKYSFEILFENKENPHCKEEPIRLRSSCHPDHEVLFQKDKYLLTHVDMLRKLSGSRGLYYSITILKDGEMPLAVEDEELQLRNYFISPNPSIFFDLNDPTLVEVRRLFRRLHLGSEDDWTDESF